MLTHCSYGLPRSRQEMSSGGEQIDGCCQDEELRAVLLQRELWIRLSQIRHDHCSHVDFGLRKGVGGKTGEDMNQGIAGRSVSGVLQPHV